MDNFTAWRGCKVCRRHIKPRAPAVGCKRFLNPVVMKNSDVARSNALSIVQTNNQRVGQNRWVYTVNRLTLAQNEDRIGAECRRDTFDLVREILHDRVFLQLLCRNGVRAPA